MAYDFKQDHRFEDLKKLNSKTTSSDGDYKLYDDKKYDNAFPNPLTAYDKNYTPTNKDKDKEEAGPHHYDEYVNPNKFVDFWLGSPSNRKGFNWRKYKPAGWGNGVEVNSGVMLIPSNAKFKASANMVLKQWSENLGKAGGIIELINSLASGISGTTYISEFGTPNLFEDVEPIKFDALTFEFKFGSAGLFSGLEEVVKPIYALALMFSASTYSEFPVRNGNIKNPFPTKMQFFFTKLQAMKNHISEIAENGLTSGATSLTQGLVNANRHLQRLISAGNMEVALSNNFKNIWMTYGPFTFGPLQCPGFNYEFDMDHLDEFGWPITGRITLNGLQTSRKGTSNAILGQIANDKLGG